MANFYADVKELLKDCDISFVEPLSYLKHFLTGENRDEKQSTDKIVLIYEHVCNLLLIFL